MTSSELRKNFLDFFKAKGHTIVPSSSLLATDPSVLFTTAGMQQFKPYYLGEKSPYGKNVASCQKCFRTSDIEEVGDERHLTFFEMLGNFSFGGYQKEEAIKLAKEFLDSIKIKIDYVTVFKGDKELPKDQESVKIWEKLGFSAKKGNLKFAGREENFWGPTGDEGPCGPTTEIYSAGIEIWNIVFNQYYQNRDRTLKDLEIFGIDTGMGLERLAKVSQNVKTVFETDLFLPIMEEIKPKIQIKNQKLNKLERIIVDHIKASVFLIADGILPSNVEQGYVLRRLLRRIIRYQKLLKMERGFVTPLIKAVAEIYKDVYPEININLEKIYSVVQNEQDKFEKTLESGLKKFENQLTILKKKEIPGKIVFDLYQSYGFPLELTEELAREKGFKIDKDEFKKEFEKHQEISRAGIKGKFGGIGKDATEQATKLHTATHLLHQALRDVLGKEVRQMGSDINSERLRFDFSYPKKMTLEQIKKVENIVNQKIKEDLGVKKEEMSYQEAIKSGALAFFKEKYPERVSVYSVGSYSKEICAGPHVKSTSELGHFKIIKEESSGAGVRRIRAILQSLD